MNFIKQRATNGLWPFLMAKNKPHVSSVADIICNKLTEQKVQHVFGYSGGCNLPLLNSFYHSKELKFHATCTEQGAGMMAIGHAKYTNSMGVVVTTSGPGMTNCVTALYDAYSDHVPLLVLSGQVNTTSIGTGAFQEAPSVVIAKPITKWAYQVTNANDIEHVMNAAHCIAMNEPRGPVFIDLPKDIQTQCVVSNALNNIMNRKNLFENKQLKFKQYWINNPYFYKFNIHQLKIDAKILLNLIKNNKKVVLFVGQGAKNAVEYIRKIAVRLKLPVCTTLHGLGIFDETHYQSLKMIGMHGSPAANYAIQTADLIVGIGARFDDRTIGTIKSYAPNAINSFNTNQGGGIVSININDINTIHPHYQFKYNVSYFLKIVWDEILKDNDFSQVNNTTNKQITYKQTKNDWLLHINELKNANKFNYESSGQLKAQDVLIKLNKLIQNKKFVITTGVGNHQMFVSMYINFRNPNCILTSGSSGTMGVCVPYLIGASYTNKNAMLIGIDGDGSFNMSYNELQNIQKYKIPIKLFIMNDGHLQMVRTWQHKFFKGNEIATKSYNPDYSKIAEAWGISYIRIESKTDLENIDLQYKLSTNEPIIFDCKIESTYCLPLVAPGKPLHEMILFEQEKSQQHFDAKDCPG